ncbi:YfhO family protein [Candidatus Microgenomates bacterium]|nr:YfhO family protein [Candidatus Microgenomates bacterium]
MKIFAPLDFLVNFYQPWDPYHNTPIKNTDLSDVIAQIIPWKLFTIESLKQGRLPWWNPFNLAGTPHLANFQTAVFNPFNLIFLFLKDFLSAWNIFILLQPLLALIFMFLFLRKQKLTSLASIFGALTFALSGFMIAWLEWGTIGYALLYLPLILYALSTKKFKWVAALAAALSIFSGHLQISIYIFLFSSAYIIFYQKKFKNLIYLAVGLCLGLIQLIPTWQMFSLSLRATYPTWDWYQAFQFPWSKLATFIAPDFFGSQVTRNYWGQSSYIETAGYIGLIPFFFALLSLLAKFKSKLRQRLRLFLGVIVLLAFLAMLPTFLSKFIWQLNIPVISSSAPSRLLSLTTFSLAILSALGFDYFIKQKPKLKKLIKPLLIIFIPLVIGWALTFINQSDPNWLVTRRNLILPTALFISLAFILSLLPRTPNLVRKTLLLALLALTSFDLLRFAYKYLPISPSEYFYPQTYLSQWFKENTDQNRVIGSFDSQMNLPFKFYKAEGYEPLALARTEQLLSSAETGQPSITDRAKGQLEHHQTHTQKILDLFSIEYLIEGNPPSAYQWDFQLWDFPEKFELIYQSGAHQVSQNLESLPQAYLVYDYQVAESPSQVLEILFNENFDHQQSVVLEQDPQFAHTRYVQIRHPGLDLGSSATKFISYEPEKIILQTSSPTPAILVLTDTYYPGWQAFIDQQPVEIYRANYNFRAVVIPAGDHQIEFKYHFSL